jgi:hypothetical protein
VEHFFLLVVKIHPEHGDHASEGDGGDGNNDGDQGAAFEECGQRKKGIEIHGEWFNEWVSPRRRLDSASEKKLRGQGSPFPL